MYNESQRQRKFVRDGGAGGEHAVGAQEAARKDAILPVFKLMFIHLFAQKKTLFLFEIQILPKMCISNMNRLRKD